MSSAVWTERSAHSVNNAQAMVTLGQTFAEFLTNFSSAAERSSTARLVALTGPLGAGKTTFTQGVAQFLGITQPIVSPTFTLAREYRVPESSVHSKFPPSLLHIDLYRVMEVEDLATQLESLDIDAALERGAWVFVEWGERLGEYFDNVLKLQFTIEEDESRHVAIS